MFKTIFASLNFAQTYKDSQFHDASKSVIFQKILENPEVIPRLAA